MFFCVLLDYYTNMCVDVCSYVKAEVYNRWWLRCILLGDSALRCIENTIRSGTSCVYRKQRPRRCYNTSPIRSCSNLSDPEQPQSIMFVTRDAKFHKAITGKCSFKNAAYNANRIKLFLNLKGKSLINYLKANFINKQQEK